MRVAVEYVRRLPRFGVDAHCLFLYGGTGPFKELLSERAHYLSIENSRDIFKLRRLPRFLRDFGAQVIHHHDGLLWSNSMTYRHPGSLKFTHAHMSRMAWPFWSRGNLVQTVQLRSTEHLICITEDTRNSFVEGGHRGNTYTVHNGVDLDRFRPATPVERAEARSQLGLPADAPVVGFVGRLHCAVKGVDDFLKMFALLPESFHALVAGSGEDEVSVKRLAVELGISGRVVFTGTLSDAGVAFHSLDAFCFTSHYENFGLSVAEAMACRVPVVGFACVGGVRELLTNETGVLLPERDLGGMAGAVIEAVRRAEPWGERMENAVELLRQRYDWDVSAARLAEIYRAALNVNGGGRVAA